MDCPSEALSKTWNRQGVPDCCIYNLVQVDFFGNPRFRASTITSTVNKCKTSTGMLKLISHACIQCVRLNLSVTIHVSPTIITYYWWVKYNTNIKVYIDSIYIYWSNYFRQKNRLKHEKLMTQFGFLWTWLRLPFPPSVLAGMHK